jgi:hypothetical protein
LRRHSLVTFWTGAPLMPNEETLEKFAFTDALRRAKSGKAVGMR